MEDERAAAAAATESEEEEEAVFLTTTSCLRGSRTSRVHRLILLWSNKRFRQNVYCFEWAQKVPVQSMCSQWGNTYADI
jgi:hypothetical protein